MAQRPDDTIMNMIENLKCTNYDFSSSNRSLSTNSHESSSDYHSPVKRLKLEKKLEVSYLGSPREVRRLRADLLEERSTIKRLQTIINNLHSARKEIELAFEGENEALKRQREYDAKTIQELENQLQSIRKREIEVKNKLSEVTSKYELLKLNSSEEIQNLEKNLTELKNESIIEQSEEKTLVQSLERKIAELETMFKAAQEDAEAHKKLAEDLSKRINQDNALQRSLELKEQELFKAKLTIKDLEFTINSYGEFQQLAKSQSEKLQKYNECISEHEQLKEEIVRLKELVKNKLILEEEVCNLKNRLTKYKDCEKKLMDLQIKENQNSMYLNEWRAVARGICESMECDAALPHQLRRIVERLQQQELNLTSQKVELESQLKTVAYEAKVAKSEVEKSQKLIQELKQTGDQKQKLIHRLEKRLTLVSRERDSYRRQLDSYEKDLTINANTSIYGNASSQLQSLKERNDNLEKIVSDYRDMVAKLETDLKNAQPHLYMETIPLKIEMMARLKDEVQQLKLENDKLRERNDELEIKLEGYMQGDDTMHGGKILHPVENPFNDRIEQRSKLVEKLQDENTMLKRKIKNYEEGIENSKLGDISINSKEVTALKEKLLTQETQTQALRDYFKSQMQEFRNVIYMLLGYKIDRTPNSIYKLTSMYAEKIDDSLCFKVKDGDFKLLENEYSAALEAMIDLHLRQQGSIPVFLSAITMDLFSNKTFSKTYSE